MSSKNLVLLDFDGVIVDSFRPAFDVTKMICPHVTEEDYRKRFEGNINDWEGPIHTPECRSDIDFFSEYIPKMENEVTLVPGMEEVIKTLSANYPLIIISSTITSPIRELLERCNLSQYFAEILGNDVHKSKVEKIEMVLSKYGVSPNQCIFITDTLGDIKEADKTGIAAIGVTWGFHSKETLASGNPYQLLEQPGAICGAISDFFETAGSGVIR